MDFEVASSLYYYDLSSGDLLHTGKTNCRLHNKKVGTKDKKGYLVTRHKDKLYKVHRIIWLLHYGEWPKNMLDHINGIKDDNNINNLREASSEANQQNIHHAQSNNKTGYLGVSHCRGKFLASIWHNGSKERIGMFTSAEEAHLAYLSRKKEVHPGFAF